MKVPQAVVDKLARELSTSMARSDRYAPLSWLLRSYSTASKTCFTILG